MKAVRFLLVAAAALFVAACLPVTTKNPVGSTVGFKADPALIGLWKGRGEGKDDKEAYIVFLAAAKGDMTAILFDPEGKDSDWNTYTMRCATLGANHYMNLHSLTKNGEPMKDFASDADILMLYRPGAGGRLTLYLVDEDKARAAIKSGKLVGKIDPGEHGDVQITADPKPLDAFFATKSGAALFTKPVIAMHRVR